MSEYQGNGNNEKAPSALITGGSGLIGRYLTSLLLAEGYKVSHLSRQTNSFGKVRVFRWDPVKDYLDPGVLEGIDYLIHLSGANIGEKRWSESRKKEIISSRVDSANLLFRSVAQNNFKLKAFITASAVGYYGSLTSEKIFTEDDPASDDFLGTTTRLWEEAASMFEKNGIRTVRIRTGIVLEKNDSALRKLMAPARAGLVVRTGSGRQYFPWIHIEDLCNIYLKAIRDEKMSGAYNAVAPQHISHDEFIRIMANLMKRPVILPPVNGWLIKLVLGEMAGVVLNGSRVSCERIQRAGFDFRFSSAEDALRNILES
jgi:uncharacterized protein (TIGR01777 family)